MKVAELKPTFSVFGNKGNVWNNTAHIYKDGNLCGTPALSTNWARIEKVEEIGCPKCLEKYKTIQLEIEAMDKVNLNILKTLKWGEEIKLNSEFTLCHYLVGGIFLNSKKGEKYQVMYDNNNIVFDKL